MAFSQPTLFKTMFVNPTSIFERLFGTNKPFERPKLFNPHKMIRCHVCIKLHIKSGFFFSSSKDYVFLLGPYFNEGFKFPINLTHSVEIV